jgi:hypothetical protein
VDPDNPAANMQKYMMYIAPFFALSGLYWQFGLVIYWVTTNIWTLGQQHILFRNLPIVGSATVGAAAAPAASGNGTAPSKAGPSKPAASRATASRASATKTGTSSVSTSKTSTSTSKAGTSSASSKTSGAPGKSAASAGRTTTSATPVTSSASTNGATGTGGTLGGLLKFGRNKAEPEPVTAAQQTKVVRQQPVRQTRSKRSGKR